MKDGLTLLCVGTIAFGLYHERERWVPHAKTLVTATASHFSLPDATIETLPVTTQPACENSVQVPVQDADFANHVAESQRLALAKYPTLGSVGEEINSRFVFRYKLLLTEHSPRLQNPDWPMQLADECAAASRPVTTKSISASSHVITLHPTQVSSATLRSPSGAGQAAD